MDYAAIINQMMRASLFDVSFYREAKEDLSLQMDALRVVFIVSLLSGIGSLISSLLSFSIFGGIRGLISAVVTGLLGYYVWGYVAHWVGVNYFGGRGDVNGVLRSLGFAHSPQAVGLLAAIPCIGWFAALASVVWSLACAVFACREAMELEITNAVIVTVAGFVSVLLLSLFITLLLGGW